MVPVQVLDMTSESTFSITRSLVEQPYVSSVILSFLNEIDGTCFLITNKAWTRKVLPLFLIPPNKVPLLFGQQHNNGNIHQLKRSRHFFQVRPVMDSTVLLMRSSTVRLARRLRRMSVARRRSAHLPILIHKSELKKKIGGQCYPLNMTTEEIAWYEWNKTRIFMSTPEWPSSLELLRYRKPPLSISLSNHADNLPPKIMRGVTLLASYPRSGNSLLRSLLEKITNLVTGSDTRPDRNLSKSLSLEHDLVGEGITQYQVTPVVKTHFPERKGWKAYDSNRIILLTRNPYDAIDSYWNMCCTNTHTESVVEEIYEKYQDKFNNLVKSEIFTWLRFTKFWLDQGLNQDPDGSRPVILLVRYEDLVLNTESTMSKVLKFLLYNDLKQNRELHPFWVARIKYALELPNTEAKEKLNRRVNTLHLGSYIPRSSDIDNDDPSESKRSNYSKISSIGKSLHKKRFSEEILMYIHDSAKEVGCTIFGIEQNLISLLRYDIYDQQFPDCFEDVEKSNLDEDLVTLLASSGNLRCIRVNLGTELREPCDPYGRAMTAWRRSKTYNDTQPFPFKRR